MADLAEQVVVFGQGSQHQGQASLLAAAVGIAILLTSKAAQAPGPK